MSRARIRLVAAGAGLILVLSSCATGRSVSTASGPGGAASPRPTSGTLTPAARLALAACPRPGSPPLSGDTKALGRGRLRCLGPGPAVDVTTLGGSRPVLVNLWASWCDPCRREMPRLERAATLAGDRLMVLGIDTLDSARSATEFLTAVQVTYPQLADPNGQVRAHIGAIGLPVTLLITPSGQVSYRKLGELHPSDLVAVLAKAGIPARADQLEGG
jgi:cytochrome c biogenesis protein CcmG/thiol:disulfide interchange protein DsbE